MLLTCPSCKTKNFLDPYPFWNFKGKTKCAGCSKIWRLETASGACVAGPEPADGQPDLLPGFAEKPDYTPISGPGLTRPAPRARKDAVCRPIPIHSSMLCERSMISMRAVSPFSGRGPGREDTGSTSSKTLSG